MFDGLLENMKEQEAELHKKMQEVVIVESKEGVTIEGNANLDISNILIEDDLLQPSKKEELTDLLVACYTTWKEKAEQEASKLSTQLVDTMLPPGFENILNNLK